jgi:capsular polysaccharide export protein
MNYWPKSQRFRPNRAESQSRIPHPIVALGAPYARRKLLRQICALHPASRILNIWPRSGGDSPLHPDPNAIALVWNGLKGRRAQFVAAARAAGHRVLFAERTAIPNRIQIDWQGVNAAHSFVQTSAPLAQGGSNWRALKSQLRAPHPRDAPPANDTTDLDRPYIFVPLQMPHDTQITHMGDWIASMDMLLTTLKTAASALPENWRILLKPHPRAKPEMTRKYASLSGDKLQLTARTDTYRMIERAELVLTVNSSVGLEAFYFDKPVLVLGHAIYQRPGTATKINSTNDLMTALACPQNISFDPLARDALMTALTSDVFFETMVKAPNTFTPTSLERIAHMIGADNHA